MSRHAREPRREASGLNQRLQLLLARCRLFLRQLSFHCLRRLAIAVVGGTVLLVGIAMVVLPGPALLVIPLGLGILATEFIWARRWLKRAQALVPNGKKQSTETPGPTPMLMPHRHYLLLLTALFGVWWVALAIHPLERNTWLLENALALAAVALLAVFHRRLLFSRVSYTLIFVFMCLHQVGAHYTYSLVPYDAWFQHLTGRTFNSLVGWERNNFDRVVHFSYGLLLAYPVREIFLRVVNVRGFWGYFLPLDLTMSTSMLFELLEWGTAAAFGGDLGQAYLGTQGDEWDAHKDMALASLGAVVTMAITALINWRLQRDFAREWVESLRVKGKPPHGEDELARMARKWKSP
jgi:putative membrane protein